MSTRPKTPSIVAVTDDFVVSCKPPGVGFHQEAGADGGDSYVDAVHAELARQGRDGPLFPVHRLDRITSGLVLCATSAAAARRFGERFAGAGIDKLYLALAAGKPTKKQGTVRGAMVKARAGSWKLSRKPGDGALAVTQFFSFGVGNGLRLFVLRPKTGRTHQLRVALKSLGTPIAGDERYHGAPADRGYLHAWRLRFSWNGQLHEYEAPPAPGEYFRDPAFADALAQVGDPWQLPWPQRGPAQD